MRKLILILLILPSGCSITTKFIVEKKLIDNSPVDAKVEWTVSKEF